MHDEVRREARQRIAEDRELDAAQARFDRHRSAAGDLHAAADQRGDIHGAAVDVKQLALEPVLGKEILLLRDPEKSLSGVNGRIGDAQLVGGGKLRGRITLCEEQREKKRNESFHFLHGTGLIQGSRLGVKPSYCSAESHFLTTRIALCYEGTPLRIRRSNAVKRRSLGAKYVLSRSPVRGGFFLRAIRSCPDLRRHLHACLQ